MYCAVVLRHKPLLVSMWRLLLELHAFCSSCLFLCPLVKCTCSCWHSSFSTKATFHCCGALSPTLSLEGLGSFWQLSSHASFSYPDPELDMCTRQIFVCLWFYWCPEIKKIMKLILQTNAFTGENFPPYGRQDTLMQTVWCKIYTGPPWVSMYPLLLCKHGTHT